MGSYRRIDHVGVAVRDLDAAIARWRDVLGFEVGGREVLPDEGVEVAFLQVGESRLELVAPLPGNAALGRFLDKRGEGVHHLCFAVDDVAATLDTLARAGAELIDRAPRPGAHGTRVAFLHPRGQTGVLVELVEDGARSKA